MNERAAGGRGMQASAGKGMKGKPRKTREVKEETRKGKGDI